jgi:hypothetical protein
VNDENADSTYLTVQDHCWKGPTAYQYDVQEYFTPHAPATSSVTFMSAAETRGQCDLLRGYFMAWRWPVGVYFLTLMISSALGVLLFFVGGLALIHNLPLGEGVIV